MVLAATDWTAFAAVIVAGGTGVLGVCAPLVVRALDRRDAREDQQSSYEREQRNAAESALAVARDIIDDLDLHHMRMRLLDIRDHAANVRAELDHVGRVGVTWRDLRQTLSRISICDPTPDFREVVRERVLRSDLCSTRSASFSKHSV